jgi:NADPH-dependent 2,4-dienoyl-CoA reductase/sulfur reductase-like enzyme
LLEVILSVLLVTFYGQVSQQSGSTFFRNEEEIKLETQWLKTDVLVIGGGTAGTMAAI